MPLVLLLFYSVLNMFLTLIVHPQELATILKLFHGLYLVRCVLVFRFSVAMVVWYLYAVRRTTAVLLQTAYDTTAVVLQTA